MDTEIWKDIPGYEGLYQASSYGRIKSSHFNRERIIKGYCDTYGYLQCSLYKDHIETCRLIHKIIAHLFCENPHQYKLVMHLDNDMTNNHYLNLRYGTQKENMMHMSLSGRSAWQGKFGANNPHSLSVVQLTLEREYINVFNSITDAYLATGCSRGSITKGCLGKVKNPYKYIWQYHIPTVQRS